MTLRSQKNPVFANMSNEQVIQAAIDVQKERVEILSRYDDDHILDDDTQELLETQLDSNEKTQNRLDDELCARDLDWPKAE